VGEQGHPALSQRELKVNRASGVDGVTVEEYGKRLEERCRG